MLDRDRMVLRRRRRRGAAMLVQRLCGDLGAAVGTLHTRPIISLPLAPTPPRSFSPTSFDTPLWPRMPVTWVYVASPLRPIHRPSRNSTPPVPANPACRVSMSSLASTKSEVSLYE